MEKNKERSHMSEGYGKWISIPGIFSWPGKVSKSNFWLHGCGFAHVISLYFSRMKTGPWIMQLCVGLLWGGVLLRQEYQQWWFCLVIVTGELSHDLLSIKMIAYPGSNISHGRFFSLLPVARLENALICLVLGNILGKGSCDYSGDFWQQNLQR